MKLVVGLGNPGREYADTRHNVGWRVVREVAGRLGAGSERVLFAGWFIKCGEVGLLRPTTYMNDSGRSVLEAMQFYKVGPEAVLLICDDLNLPTGRLRLRAEGTDGGHNGLADVFRLLGHNQVPRLRIGIGPAVGDGRGFVLSPFTADELPVIEQAVAAAADCVQTWLAEGISAAMNRFNRRPEA
jgi:PTH1 family peptidyl-tRNA hydrolase